MSTRRPLLPVVVLLTGALFTACTTTVPKDALRLPPESLQDRQLQTRRFDGIPEADMLAACAGILQDLGFAIDESETELGVIVASKERSAVEPSEVTAAWLTSLLSAMFGSANEPVYSKRQVIRVALVTRPAGTEAKDSFLVRVTFQRVVYDNNDRVRRMDRLNDEELYQQFFDKLAQSVFLEAQEI